MQYNIVKLQVRSFQRWKLTIPPLWQLRISKGRNVLIFYVQWPMSNVWSLRPFSSSQNLLNSSLTLKQLLLVYSKTIQVNSFANKWFTTMKHNHLNFVEILIFFLFKVSICYSNSSILRWAHLLGNAWKTNETNLKQQIDWWAQ